MSAARPLVAVHKSDGSNAKQQLVMPAVLLAPIRPDIVNFVHTQMAKNKRQAYGIDADVGHKHSAHSWGTGRAVSRIPRVSGGGTSRAGQAAFGNMCRKGRMYNPHRTWRKWHRKINTNQKRYAVASALAASALPSLVMARGHKIDQVPEVPLVMDAAVESVTKTKQAIAALKSVGAYDDAEKARDSKKLRAGKGKMRNRRYVQRRGPLVVYETDNGLTRAFRNLPGVETCDVTRLNLLQLAPGGHMGRFVVWTEGAFSKLNSVWGSVNRESTQKKGYTLPRPFMANADLTRLINSEEVQSRLRPAHAAPKRTQRQKKNPLKNLGVKIKLNPYAAVLRRSEIVAQQARAAGKDSKVRAARAAATKKAKKAHGNNGTKNYNRMVAP
jgi:large subunit ribosomal protein L4e